MAKIKCDRCSEFFENIESHNIIQKNVLTDEMVCMDCAFKEYDKEDQSDWLSEADAHADL